MVKPASCWSGWKSGFEFAVSRHNIGMTLPSVSEIRAQFPALAQDFAFLENAGGSHLPLQVLEPMAQFARTDYVQTGSPYPASERTTQMLKDAHTYVNRLFNGEGIGHVAMGQSATALLYMLANCLSETMVPGDEVIVSVANHESNAGPWARLAKKGITVKWWGVDPQTGLSSIDDLRGLITDRTRVVAFPRTSNLVGDIQDVRAITEAAHSVGAVVVADAVASASHEPLDVRAWGCDFCAVSHYKIYGPHVGSMFGRTEAWARLDGPNHYFISAEGSASRFELGCQSYEGLTGILGLADYLGFILGEPANASRDQIERGFARMTELESDPKRTLLAYLSSHPDLRVLGTIDGAPRHPTFSFGHAHRDSAEIAQALCDRGFGVKSGHMYAYRLCEALGIEPSSGVVRISAVHYNSHQEIEALIATLDEVL